MNNLLIFSDDYIEENITWERQQDIVSHSVGESARPTFLASRDGEFYVLPESSTAPDGNHYKYLICSMDFDAYHGTENKFYAHFTNHEDRYESWKTAYGNSSH